MKTIIEKGLTCFNLGIHDGISAIPINENFTKGVCILGGGLIIIGLVRKFKCVKDNEKELGGS